MTRRRLLPICMLPLLLAVGCSTTAMKGTPFFTGEYHSRQGPPEDRVNLWPLAYYREPALSALWPVGEYVKKEHFAVRPLFSVYNLDAPGRREWNVLWPIMQQDDATGIGRVFPLFWWGEDYFVTFPLYWHFTTGGTLRDLLFPVWWYEREREYRRFVTLLGLAGREEGRGIDSWWLAPFAGNLNRADGSHYRYWLWPIGHDMEDGNRRWSAVLPLWYSAENGDDWRRMAMLLWWQGGNADEDWRMLLPLFWSAHGADRETFYTLLGGWSKSGQERSWLLPLLLSGGSSSPEERKSFALGGLGYWREAGAEKSSHIIPLYMSSSSADRESFYTLLGGWSKTGQRRSWLLPLLLSGGSSAPGESKAVVFGGLGYRAESGQTKSSHVIPLYAAGTSEKETHFLSLAWSQRERKDGTGWTASPLHYHGHYGDGHLTLSPFYLSGSDQSEHRDWRAVLPLYYSGQSGDRHTFATLLGGRETGPDGQATTIYPLLSRVAERDGVHDWWFLAPLAHFRWDAEGSRSHVAPLYYHDSEAGAFVSPLYARWVDEEDRFVVVPPLLSWRLKDGPRDEWWVLAGLAHLSLGAEKGSSHVLPLYYTNPESHAFISLPYARQDDGTNRLVVVPPLLSWRTQNAQRDDWWLAAGLGHLSLGPQPGSSYVLPVYYHEKDLTLSLAYCEWSRPGETGRFFPPLLSGYSRNEGASEFWSLAGLYSHEWRRDGTQSDWLLPLYAWAADDYLYTPLAGWNEHGFRYYLTPLVSSWKNERDSGFRVFPLYAHSREPSGATKTRVLWSVTHSRPDYKRSVFFPLYGYTYTGPLDAAMPTNVGATAGSDFFCLPFCWYQNIATRGYSTNGITRTFAHGAFPLWSYKTETGAGRGSLSEQSLLWFLYDRRREQSAGGDHEYVQHRVLWRLWHYEKLNGDVSVDALPGLTWDSRKDGYRKASFLWRVFRWEKAPDGKRKLDLLFIPLLRDG